MKTGNTSPDIHSFRWMISPQWSPVMKTGNTIPGHVEGRIRFEPQWSPVMKTGNTRVADAGQKDSLLASMEPGHEDREYR